uniref:Ig-like domain-containing protein n=1 Tax=Equus caballus TaxID=9796 RepID=A0A5F5Q1X9_HORSE
MDTEGEPQEPTDAGVIQTPRHQLTKMGQTVTLTCEPISTHDTVFWYRQTSVKGLEFLIYFRDQAPMDKTGMPNDRFSAEMPNGSFSTLKIQRTEPGDAAVYLCASSLTTALQSHPLSVQKPLLPFLVPAPSPCSSLPRFLPISTRTWVWCFTVPREGENKIK